MQSTGVMVPSLIVLAALVVIHIVIGLVADNLYRKKIAELVKNIDEKLSKMTRAQANALADHLNAGYNKPA